jgi:hypothetical protein
MKLDFLIAAVPIWTLMVLVLAGLLASWGRARRARALELHVRRLTSLDADVRWEAFIHLCLVRAREVGPLAAAAVAAGGAAAEARGTREHLLNVIKASGYYRKLVRDLFRAPPARAGRALDVLEKIAEPGTDGLFALRLKTSHGGLRDRLLSLLVKFDHAPVIDHFRRTPPVSGWPVAKQVALLREAGPAIISRLREGVASPDPEQRRWSTTVLAGLAHPKAVEGLVAALRAGSEGERAQILDALGRHEDSLVVTAMIQVAREDPSWFCRLKAITYLNRRREPEVSAFLRELYGDLNWFRDLYLMTVRETAAAPAGNDPDQLPLRRIYRALQKEWEEGLAP